MANRKNNSPVIWPEGHFTIKEAHARHASMVEITLRFRIKKAVENGEIVVIGRIKPAIGRPNLVFAKAPASKELREAAYKAGVLPPKDECSTTVNVADVRSKKSKSEPVSEAPTAAVEQTTASKAEVPTQQVTA